MRVDEPLGDRQARARRRRRSGCRRVAGTAATTSASAPCGRCPGPGRRRGCGTSSPTRPASTATGCAERAVAHGVARGRWRGCVRAAPRRPTTAGRSPGIDVEHDVDRRVADAVRPRRAPSSATSVGRRCDGQRADLQPAGVEQVADEPVQPVGLLVDGGERLGELLRRPVDVGVAQARDHRLDRRQRRAQVVRDGPQQRRAHGVDLGEQRRRRRPPRPGAGCRSRPRAGRRAPAAARWSSAVSVAAEQLELVAGPVRRRRAASGIAATVGPSSALAGWATTGRRSPVVIGRDARAPSSPNVVRTWSTSRGHRIGVGGEARPPTRASASASSRARRASSDRVATRCRRACRPSRRRRRTRPAR